jgi:hypothetical protein
MEWSEGRWKWSEWVTRSSGSEVFELKWSEWVSLSFGINALFPKCAT